MANKLVSAILKQRRNTASNWNSSNPILASGQMGLETDTFRFKVGDGSTAWNSLPYYVDDFYEGFNSVTTLSSLPITKRSIVATVAGSTTLSLSGTLRQGRELHIKVYNNSGAELTQSLPTSTPWESKKTDGSDISSVKIPAGGSLELSIWAVNSKYIIKGEGSIGTLEQVTTAGNTTTKQIICTNANGMVTPNLTLNGWVITID